MLGAWVERSDRSLSWGEADQEPIIKEVVPIELVLHILTFLNASYKGIKDVAICSMVCRQWNAIITGGQLKPSLRDPLGALQMMFSTFAFFRAAEWKQYAGDLSLYGCHVSKEMTVNRHFAAALSQLYKQEMVKSSGGVKAITLPQGLSLNDLVQISFNPNKGKAIEICLGAFIDSPFVYDRLKSTHTMLIFEVACQEGREIEYVSIQDDLKKLGYQLANALQVTIFLATHYASTESIIGHQHTPKGSILCADRWQGENVYLNWEHNVGNHTPLLNLTATPENATPFLYAVRLL